jgi:hypothetical protein
MFPSILQLEKPLACASRSIAGREGVLDPTGVPGQLAGYSACIINASRAGQSHRPDAAPGEAALAALW